jgi:hypothetical protein
MEKSQSQHRLESTLEMPTLCKKRKGWATRLSEVHKRNWQLVFVFGLPRSGTTWVGKIFDSHPQTLYKHEPDTFAHLPELPWAPEISEANALRQRIEEILRLLPDTNTSSVAGSLPVFSKAYRSGWQQSAHWLSVWAAKAGQRVFRNSVVLPFANYPTAPCLVWKSINSLGRLGVLMRVTQHRKAIILLRHPCGVIASLKRGRAFGHLHTDQSTDYNLLGQLLNTGPGKRHGLSIDELRRMHPEERLAWKWVLAYEKVSEDTVGMDDEVLVLRYEDVCKDPTDLAQRMFQWAGLGWSPQTESFIQRSTTSGRNRRHVRFPRFGYFSVFQDPVWSASRWRHELTPDEIERILNILNRSHLRQFYAN